MLQTTALTQLSLKLVSFMTPVKQLNLKSQYAFLPYPTMMPLLLLSQRSKQSFRAWRPLLGPWEKNWNVFFISESRMIGRRPPQGSTALIQQMMAPPDPSVSIARPAETVTCSIHHVLRVQLKHHGRLVNTRITRHVISHPFQGRYHRRTVLSHSGLTIDLRLQGNAFVRHLLVGTTTNHGHNSQSTVHHLLGGLVVNHDQSHRHIVLVQTLTDHARPDHFKIVPKISSRSMHARHHLCARVVGYAIAEAATVVTILLTNLSRMLNNEGLLQIKVRCNNCHTTKHSCRETDRGTWQRDPEPQRDHRVPRPTNLTHTDSCAAPFQLLFWRCTVLTTRRVSCFFCFIRLSDYIFSNTWKTRSSYLGHYRKHDIANLTRYRSRC